jgi:hypothetical protein
MGDSLNALLDKLRAEDRSLERVGLSARVWQRIDAARLGPRTILSLQIIRALPVVFALLMGSAVGARSFTPPEQISAFSATPAYSVMRLVE